MGGKGRLFRNWLLCSFILCFMVTSLGVSGVAFAQDDMDEFLLEEIVVTGSRIARNNNESTSPIVTVDESLFDQSGTSAIETQLNKLPQFTPTIDVPQIAGQDIQPTATNTPGEATVALRGIGSNRTLVLINGRRGTPSNASGVLDINTIPTAAIQYVEAISGGASSTYGADAMAGVLNFIMKDRFEGFEIDVQGGMTQEVDNIEYNISGVMGTNFADDRGNVMMAFAYNDRNDAQQRDRSWFRENWANPSIGGSQFFPNETGLVIGYPNFALPPDQWAASGNLPSEAALESVMPGADFPAVNYGFNVYTDANGNAFSGFQTNGQPGIPVAKELGIVDGFNVKELNSGNLGTNNVDSYLIFPLERWNFYTQGNYEINDYVGVFGQAYFSKTSARTIQESSPITGGWGVRLDPTRNREAIPEDILTLLDSRPDPTAPFEINAMAPVNRVGNSDTFTFNMTTGLEGDVPGIDWTWEAFVSYGESENTAEMTGFFSLERLRGIMGGIKGYDATGNPIYFEGYKNFGEGLEITGNEEYGGFGAATATCTSGLNPFDWASVTQDCWDAVNAPVKSKQIMKQTIYQANTQGLIADLPMGAMRGALGVNYRQQDYDFVSDNVNTQGRSWNDQIMGLYPAGESEGKIDAKEAYAELLVPVLSELPFAEQVNLEFGGRRSDYNTTGTSYTYKAQVDWRTNSWLRFRGGYNRAERAPNVAELFLARTSSFGAMSYGDTCSMRNQSIGWTANPDVNPDNWYNIVALCGQKMDEADPDGTASVEFYGNDWQQIVDYAEANPGAGLSDLVDAGIITQQDIDDQPAGGFGWIWPVDQGNPNLEPEQADTWTFGFVMDSFIEDIPALMDWRISVDYYTIEIEKAIGLQTGDVVLQQCMSTEFNPTLDPNSPFCDGMTRNASGGVLGTLARSYFNNGRFNTSGIDLQINWSMDAGPGRVRVSSLLNYLLKMESAELPSNPLIDYVGTFGPSGNGLNGNSIEWRALTNFTYSMSDWDVTLRWQFLDELKSISGPGTPLESYHMFDLLGNWRATDNIQIRFGIENFLNLEPELYGRNFNDPNDMYGGSFSNQLNDTNGRRFYLGTKIYF